MQQRVPMSPRRRIALAVIAIIVPLLIFSFMRFGGSAATVTVQPAVLSPVAAIPAESYPVDAVVSAMRALELSTDEINSVVTQLSAQTSQMVTLESLGTVLRLANVSSTTRSSLRSTLRHLHGVALPPASP